ncbi:MAG: FAD-dependent oxidoreductase [Pseudomonadota bacterium]
MHVAVIGAGIAGTLTAHYLTARGLTVTVYEAAGQPASGASAANGAQLSYSFSDPLNDPTLLSRLPGIFFGRDRAFRIGRTPRPEFLGWGLRFLRHCTAAGQERSSRALLELSRRSAQLMPALLEQHMAPEHRHRTGKLVLLPDPASPELERRLAVKQELGFPVRLLDADETIAQEPSLTTWATRPAAAISCATDEAADAARFCRTLSEHLMQQQTRFAFGEAISALTPDARSGWRLTTTATTHHADAVVLCNGLGAKALLQPLGVRLPLLAMEGHSLTLPATAGSPRASLTAHAQRIVFSPFGKAVRIAGFADLNGPGRQPERQRQLLAVARALAPHAADYETAEPQGWSGTRVMTPDSLPIVGQLPAPGLFSNLGHGMLGWTLGAACADAVAAAVAQEQDR